MSPRNVKKRDNINVKKSAAPFPLRSAKTDQLEQLNSEPQPANLGNRPKKLCGPSVDNMFSSPKEKACVNCGKGTVKPQRIACKHCGGREVS